MSQSRIKRSPESPHIGPVMANGDFFSQVPHSNEATPDTFGSTPLGSVADRLSRHDDARAIDSLTQDVEHEPVVMSDEDHAELARLRAEKQSRERRELDALRSEEAQPYTWTAPDSDAETTPWYRKRGFLVGGSIAGLALAGTVALGMRGGSGEGTDRLPAATETIGEDGAIAVDGNQFPEKANKTFDDIFGIYDGIGPDGKLEDYEGLADKWGLEPVKINEEEAVALTTPYDEITGTQNFDLLTVQHNALDRAIGQIEIVANAINMNNDVVKFTRLQKIEDEEQAALYANAILAEEILQVSYESGSVVNGNMFVSLLSNSPNDAGLRAVLSRINTPSDPTFRGAGPEGSTLRSLFRDNGDVRNFPTDGSKAMVGTLTFNIAWVNPAGEIDHYSEISSEIMIKPTKSNSEVLFGDVVPRAADQ